MNEENIASLAKIREKLSKLKGPKFWRSLDELAETGEFNKFLKEEYPYGAADFETPVDRREFLKLMGASLLLGGLAGCKPQPLEKIVPYVKSPEQVVAGKPLFFATSMPFNGAAAGVLVESHMGRPTKIEGNPEHPDSLGATHAFAQASILGLYDPDRAKVLMNAGRIRTWDAFIQELAKDLELQAAKKGAGLRILTESVTSPTLAYQIRKLLEKYPQAKWHQYSPLSRDADRKGAKIAFGEYADALYDLSAADVVVSLDSDFLFALPGSVRYAREFIARRQVPEPGTAMNRLYAVESAPSLTGAMADNRLPLKPSEVTRFALQLAAALGVSIPEVSLAPLEGRHQKWIQEIAKDLKARSGKSLVIAGPEQPAAVQAVAAAMNEILKNAGKTVRYIRPVDENPVEQMTSLKELAKDLDEGTVDLLLVMNANPVYSAPRDLDFAKKYVKAKRRIYFSSYEDETAALSHWLVPQSHYLEMFSDSRASDGTVSMIQPLIHPLYSTKSAHEVLAAVLGQPAAEGEAIVQDYWKSQWGEQNFEKNWKRALHAGLITGTAFKPLSLKAKTSFTAQDLSGSLPPSTSGQESFEAVFRPDPSVWDGQFFNNGWMQELPKILTTLTWDNAALISPQTAEALGLETQDVVKLELNGAAVEAPVLILPGHPNRAATLHLGYGRKTAARLGSGIGFNAYSLRGSENPGYAAGLKITKTGRKHKLALTQTHHSMHGRDLIRKTNMDEYTKHPDFVHAHAHGGQNTSLYPPYKYDSYAWGMAVNLNACIGCNACVIACQSENSIPVVGKEQVLMGREMHWIRVDRYYEGDVDHPEMLHQPVLCMHCENAPCEPVCPVGATVHSSEGLNEMVYNRCVGTRYCSNNCPYKVRRFNFFDYVDDNIETMKMQRNPDVTVRGRGVMEKCTFCVQRINSARIEAKKEDRTIREGELRTACQSACPTNALVFGDINNPDSEVTKLKASVLNYGLLTELNTLPRVSYLAKIGNPNPALTAVQVSHGR